MDAQLKLSGRIGLISLLMVMLVINGCALINPHVSSKWDRPTRNASEGVPLASALDYADKAIKSYREALGEQATFTNLLGVSLIPLSAGAIVLGIAEVDPIIIATVAATGAAGLGVGMFLTNKERPIIYTKGIAALACAKAAVQPFNISKDDEERFERNLRNLQQNMRSTQKYLSETQSLTTQLEDESIDASRKPTAFLEWVDEEVTRTKKIIEEHEPVLTNGLKLQLELQRVGELLVAAVDKISAEVDAALAKTISDMETLKGIIGGLAKQAQEIGPVAKPQEPAGETSKPLAAEAELTVMENMATGLMGGITEEQSAKAERISDLSKSIKKTIKLMVNARTDLARAGSEVWAVINSVGDAPASALLEQCGVEPKEKKAPDLSVQPSGDIVFETRPSTKRLVVSGGKPSYFAYLLDTDVKGLTAVSSPSLGVPFIEVSITNDTPNGKYNLYIKDSAEAGKMIGIAVKAPGK